jgi:hypothetical protein
MLAIYSFEGISNTGHFGLPVYLEQKKDALHLFCRCNCLFRHVCAGATAFAFIGSAVAKQVTMHHHFNVLCICSMSSKKNVVDLDFDVEEDTDAQSHFRKTITNLTTI